VEGEGLPVLLTVLFLLFSTAAFAQPLDAKPHDVTPVGARFNLNLSPAAAKRAARKLAGQMGARIDESNNGKFVFVLKRPATALDEYCVYPIINRTTGGHLHTFLTWQLGLFHAGYQEDSRLASGDVLLKMSFEPGDGGRTRLDFWSNCVTDTELGRLPAESTGKFERAFVGQLAAAAGQSVDFSALPANHSLDAPAEVDYKPVADSKPGIHESVLRALRPGVSERTAVKSEIAADIGVVWSAAVRATRRFADVSGLTIMSVDERLRQIQNGSAAGPQDAARPWREEFVTSITDAGRGKTRITVVRRLLVPSRDGHEWHAAASDGELESWLIGAVMNEVSKEGH
jgi:hypothetical protein